MKKTLFITLLLTLPFISKSQDAPLEKTMFGLQTSLTGIWIFNESRLSNHFTLRTELGINTLLYTKNSNREFGFITNPELIVEPRWYYNFSKRQSESKNTKFNSANFIGLKVAYLSDQVIFSNYEDPSTFNSMGNSMLFIPKWVMRRSFGNRFFYELGGGVGYAHYFSNNSGDVAIDIHVKIGLKF